MGGFRNFVSVAAAVLVLSGCESRESWMQEICARESGLEQNAARPLLDVDRIETDRVMLDAAMGIGNDRGPIYTWMSERGFSVVEIWHKPITADTTSPVAAVDRYSLGPPDALCVTGYRFDEATTASLGLGPARCVRLEKNVAPTARYLIASQSQSVTRTIGDRINGYQPFIGQFDLVDRETRTRLYTIERAGYSGTWLGPRGNACDTFAEVATMKLVLRSPRDNRTWLDIRREP